MTAMSLKGDLGRREKAFEWLRSMSPNAQYTAAADGSVSVITYRVASKYMALNFWGFHIACIISLQVTPAICSIFSSFLYKKKNHNNNIIFTINAHYLLGVNLFLWLYIACSSRKVKNKKNQTPRIIHYALVKHSSWTLLASWPFFLW